MSLNLNIIVVGESGVGKTTYLQRLINGHFIKQHQPTTGIRKHVLNYIDNLGNPLVFNLYEVSGSSKVTQDGFNFVPDGAIIICDLTTSKQEQTKIEYQFNYLQQTLGNIPIVFCGNKVDIKGASSGNNYYPPRLCPNFSTNRMYFFLSAKSNYNFEKTISSTS